MSELVQEQLCNIAMIANQRGLHARAAARFVKLAEAFKSDITITRDEIKVSARSIMGLMMLAATQGTNITICASGPDAALAITELTDFVKRKFDEEP
jgi:phosphocarrier protein HPr